MKDLNGRMVSDINTREAVRCHRRIIKVTYRWLGLYKHRADVRCHRRSEDLWMSVFEANESRLRVTKMLLKYVYKYACARFSLILSCRNKIWSTVVAMLSILKK